MRASLFRLLLAVLVWMQIMMYAWPEYAETGNGLTAQDVSLLRWAQWMLALPLMIYCARPVLRSAWQGLRRGSPGLDLPAAFALLAAFAVSTQATFTARGPVWFDSLSMFLVFLLAARHLAQHLRHRSLLAILENGADLPAQVQRRDAAGQWQLVDLADLQAGDVCLAEQGAAVAADGVLLDDKAHVSEAMITGEDAPIHKRRSDLLRAGSRLLSAAVQFRVSAVGADSTVGQIGQRIMEAVSYRPAHLSRLDRWSVPLLLTLVTVSALAGMGAESGWWNPEQVPPSGAGWETALAVLMVSCPCAISLAAPVAWLSAVMRLRKSALLLRDADALQRLDGITEVVFDKTGTLSAAPSVKAIQWTDAGTSSARGSVINRVSRDDAQCALRRMAGASLHPLSRAIADHLGTQEPFENMREEAGKGVEAIDEHGRQWRLGHAHWCGMDPSRHASVPGFLSSTGSVAESLRKDNSTVWLAMRDATPEQMPANGAEGAINAAALQWTPLCGIWVQSTPRAGYQNLLAACRQRGWGIHLWSGDLSDAVSAFAAQVGIQAARGDMKPHDKLQALLQLQRNGSRVLMIGDGLNDAPALAVADVSLAMGGGSQLSQLQADGVILGVDLNSVVTLLALADRLKQTVRQNIAWAVAYNIVAVPLAALGLLTPLYAGIGMALSSAVVTLNAMRLLSERKLSDGYSVFADTDVGGAGVCDRGRIGMERECRPV